LAIDLSVRALAPGGVAAAREGLNIAADPLSALSLVVIASATAVVAFCAQAFFAGGERAAAAFSPALVLATGGAWCGPVSARRFTTLFVFAELAWLASTALVALSSHKSRGALNGALRMLTLGGVAAAFLVLGVGLAERGLGGVAIGEIAGARIGAPNLTGVGV